MRKEKSEKQILEIIDDVFKKYEEERDLAYKMHDRETARLHEASLRGIHEVWRRIQDIA